MDENLLLVLSIRKLKRSDYEGFKGLVKGVGKNPTSQQFL
jgi:hypothetical protein